MKRLGEVVITLCWSCCLKDGATMWLYLKIRNGDSQPS